MSYVKITSMTIQGIINQSKEHTPNVLVIGDLILDQYIWTNVNRISPEAPVPICHVQHTTYVLGAAGNVSNNLKSLGANVSIAGIIGKDQTGVQIKQKLDKKAIDTSLVIQSDSISSILKSRVVANKQQLCRLDYEDITQDIQAESDQLSTRINEAITNFDILIISDYGKGLIKNQFSQAIITTANAHGIPVIVDPKGFQLDKYNGATYITPNLKEFLEITNTRAITNEDEIDALGKQILTSHNIGNVILTRSEDGISVISKQLKKDFPTKAKEVTDITGAGDTVVAALAYGLALSLPIEDVIEFSNLAAGVVVSKLGTETATIEEIKNYG